MASSRAKLAVQSARMNPHECRRPRQTHPKTPPQFIRTAPRRRTSARMNRATPPSCSRFALKGPGRMPRESTNRIAGLRRWCENCPTPRGRGAAPRRAPHPRVARANSTSHGLATLRATWNALDELELDNFRVMCDDMHRFNTPVEALRESVGMRGSERERWGFSARTIAVMR